ncbi:hypothetical protein [Erythrobacter sp. R86502]|uniref:hypothetical protein n=1 Tax=Erythrobacter sp. R86502 TaxID=3093846 RepID=UPI0036D32005
MDLDTLVPIGQYAPPALPTQERFHAILAKLKAMFVARTGTDIIANERLTTDSLRQLDRDVITPICSLQIEALDAASVQWLAKPASPGTILAIITAPCDQNDSFTRWANQSDLHRIDPPSSRSAPINWGPLEALPTHKTLVIPQLERWFLRSAEGLDRVRQLMTILAQKRRVIVGCNSFAWAYLSKAIRIDLIAPGPFTFKPLDGEALGKWLTERAHDSDAADFRLVDSDISLLQDRTSKEAQHFFQTLAGRSRGIPSTAWHMWQEMLRIDEPDAINHGAQGDHSRQRDDYWVASLEELILPGTYPRELLFALHGLCLHGGLSTAELTAIMPEAPGAAMIPALRTSQFVQEHEGILSIRPEAYLAIRSGLQSSGFPLGAI